MDRRLLTDIILLAKMSDTSHGTVTAEGIADSLINYSLAAHKTDRKMELHGFVLE